MGIGTGSAVTLLPDAITLVVANVIAATNTRNALIMLRLVVQMIRVIVFPPYVVVMFRHPVSEWFPQDRRGGSCWGLHYVCINEHTQSGDSKNPSAGHIAL